MNNDINYSSRRQNNRAFTGLFLIALGGIYLLRHLGFFFFPTWLFSWPMILIIIGVLSGIKHNFTRPGAYILIFIGGLSLLAHLVCVSLFFFWPLILIAIGISMVAGRNHNWGRNRWDNRFHNDNSINL